MSILLEQGTRHRVLGLLAHLHLIQTAALEGLGSVLVADACAARGECCAHAAASGGAVCPPAAAVVVCEAAGGHLLDFAKSVERVTSV